MKSLLVVLMVFGLLLVPTAFAAPVQISCNFSILANGSVLGVYIQPIIDSAAGEQMTRRQLGRCQATLLTQTGKIKSISIEDLNTGVSAGSGVYLSNSKDVRLDHGTGACTLVCGTYAGGFPQVPQSVPAFRN